MTSLISLLKPNSLAHNYLKVVKEAAAAAFEDS